MGAEATTTGLRILAADENEITLREVDDLLTQLGHTVVAHAVNVGQASDRIVEEDPDLSIVMVMDDDDHALDLIEELSAAARGPIVALVGSHGSDFVSRAALRGVYAFARPGFLEEIQGAIEIALARHAEAAALAEQVDRLETALERRAAIERAKGILMERHAVEEREAFAILRDRARATNRTVVDLAAAVSAGRALLPAMPDGGAPSRREGAAPD